MVAYAGLVALCLLGAARGGEPYENGKNGDRHWSLLAL